MCAHNYVHAHCLRLRTGNVRTSYESALKVDQLWREILCLTGESKLRPYCFLIFVPPFYQPAVSPSKLSTLEGERLSERDRQTDKPTGRGRDRPTDRQTQRERCTILTTHTHTHTRTHARTHTVTHARTLSHTHTPWRSTIW